MHESVRRVFVDQLSRQAAGDNLICLHQLEAQRKTNNEAAKFLQRGETKTKSRERSESSEKPLGIVTRCAIYINYEGVKEDILIPAVISVMKMFLALYKYRGSACVTALGFRQCFLRYLLWLGWQRNNLLSV